MRYEQTHSVRSHDIDAMRVSQDGIVTRHRSDSGDVRIQPIVMRFGLVRAFLEKIEYLRTSSLRAWR